MRSIILCASLLLAFAACKKEDSAPGVAQTLRGKWKISASKRTSFYYYTQRDTTINYFPLLEPCYKDDLLTLKEGFTGEVYYGTNQCTKAEQIFDEITWQVVQKDSVLEVNNAKQMFFGANPMRGQLVGKVGNTFTIRYKNNEVDSFSRPEVVTYENTYTRQ